MYGSTIVTRKKEQSYTNYIMRSKLTVKDSMVMTQEQTDYWADRVQKYTHMIVDNIIWQHDLQ